MCFTDANTSAVGSLCMRVGGGESQKADDLEQWFPTFWLIYVQPRQFTTRAAMISQLKMILRCQIFS